MSNLCPVDVCLPRMRCWQVTRKEALRITVHGQAEFEAHDVTLTGDLAFDVPDGWRMTVTAAATGLGWQTRMEPLASPGQQPSWQWRYSQRSDGDIHLRMDERATPEVGLVDSSRWTSRSRSLSKHQSGHGSPEAGPVIVEPWWAAASAEPLDHSWLSSQL